jgi:hypothetical protein
MEKHRICLTVGDWSGDGHEQSDNFYILSSLDKDSLAAAYKKGVEAIGFDLKKELDEYEEGVISSDKLRLLSKHGLLSDWGFDEEKLSEDWELYHEIDTYAELWLRIAKVGDPQLEFELVEDNAPTLHIGGYGIYLL